MPTSLFPQKYMYGFLSKVLILCDINIWGYGSVYSMLAARSCPQDASMSEPSLRRTGRGDSSGFQYFGKASDAAFVALPEAAFPHGIHRDEIDVQGAYRHNTGTGTSASASASAGRVVFFPSMSVYSKEMRRLVLLK